MAIVNKKASIVKKLKTSKALRNSKLPSSKIAKIIAKRIRRTLTERQNINSRRRNRGLAIAKGHNASQGMSRG